MTATLALASLPKGAQPWPSLAGWMGDDVPDLNKAIVLRAFADVGICEVPGGSNRSGRIDEFARRGGSPVGSYWCALAVAAWWEDAGATVPPSERGSCDKWLAWAKAGNSFSDTPVIGAAVLYGKPTDATHIGIVIRTSPYLLSIEGNTSFSGFSTNGEAVLVKKLDAARAIGYVHPTKAAM